MSSLARYQPSPPTLIHGIDQLLVAHLEQDILFNRNVGPDGLEQPLDLVRRSIAPMTDLRHGKVTSTIVGVSFMGYWKSLLVMRRTTLLRLLFTFFGSPWPPNYVTSLVPFALPFGQCKGARCRSNRRCPTLPGGQLHIDGELIRPAVFQIEPEVASCLPTRNEGPRLQGDQVLSRRSSTSCCSARSTPFSGTSP
uniref:Uncharacterized protein n=1 Tax=Noctiluca scintillans TaxID=2966 RepID=A0A6T8RGG4_NOCSC|mmetsp:Transcript_11402/g.31845  ORF Transcript_11402/g.31845 Transcript_11402/m.31845 type:complete len:195 (+) Transcript_11402:1078-1662(+)